MDSGSTMQGVAVLIRNGLDISIELCETSYDGRLILVEAAMNNEVYTTVSTYGPNKNVEAVKFYRKVVEG